MRNTWTTLQQEIFRALCLTSGSRINQRALAAKLGVTPAAVSRALPLLQEEGLVDIKGHGTMNLKEIELNSEDRRANHLKRVENLRQFYLSGCADFLAETYAGCAIVLFGSYSSGEDTVTSDVDIAVIGAKEKKMDLSRYEKVLGRPLRLMYLRSLADVSKEFRESLFNGIVLEGSITL